MENRQNSLSHFLKLVSYALNSKKISGLIVTVQLPNFAPRMGATGEKRLDFSLFASNESQ